MDLTTKTHANPLPPVVLQAQGPVGAGTYNGAAVYPMHALRFACFFLEVTAAGAVVGDTLDVTLQESHNNTTWFDWARFATITGTTAVPDFSLYQAHPEQHSDAIVTDAQLTAVLAAGADRIGTALGDHFPLPYLRARAVVVGGTAAFTWRVLLHGSGN